MRKLFLLAIVLCVWSVVADAQESERRYIEVTGSSEIEVVPDEIHLLIQIKEYWKEEFVPKSKPEDYKTKVPLEWIEKDLRRVLSRAGISDEAIRVQEIGDYWRQKGKEFLIGKQLDIRFTDFEKINAVIKKIDTKGIESMRIGELKHKDLPNYRKQGKIEALKADSLKKIATKENADSLHKVIDKNKDDIQRLTPEEMNRRRTGTHREKKPEQIQVEQHIQKERIEQRKERQMNQRRKQQQRRSNN